MTIAYVRACMPFFLLLPLLVSPLFRSGSSYRARTCCRTVSYGTRGLIALPLIQFALCIVVFHPNPFPFWPRASFVHSSDHQLSSVYFIDHSFLSQHFTIHEHHTFSSLDYFTHRLFLFRVVIVWPLSWGFIYVYPFFLRLQ